MRWIKKLWADICTTLDRLEEEAGIKNQRRPDPDPDPRDTKKNAL